MSRIVKLLTWNVQRRVAYEPQADVVAERRPDIVAFQEMSPHRVALWAERLGALGLTHRAFSHARSQENRRPFGIMVASRWPLEPSSLYEERFQESILPVRIAVPGGGLELHAAHVPCQAGRDKAVTLGALYGQLASPAPRPYPRLLCGDLNAPQREFADGSVMTFGQSLRVSGLPGVIRSKHDLDRAERSIFKGLADVGFRDAFRTLHGYGVEASSWRHYRLDHIFVGAGLEPQTCHYLNSVRADNLSDHAALEATFSAP